MSHVDEVAKARKALEEVFSDTSVPPAQTRESLELLVEEIESMLDSLPKETE